MRIYSSAVRTIFRQGNAANFNVPQIRTESGCGHILANKEGSGTGYGFKYGHGGMFYPHVLIQYWSSK